MVVERHFRSFLSTMTVGLFVHVLLVPHEWGYEDNADGVTPPIPVFLRKTTKKQEIKYLAGQVFIGLFLCVFSIMGWGVELMGYVGEKQAENLAVFSFVRPSQSCI